MPEPKKEETFICSSYYDERCRKVSGCGRGSKHKRVITGKYSDKEKWCTQLQYGCNVVGKKVRCVIDHQGSEGDKKND